MGGDFAPEETIKGAILALSNTPGLDITLIGETDRLANIIQKQKFIGHIDIHNATQNIGMNESPVSAIREKKDASINVALDLLKSGTVSAVVSAGNTGAFMAGSLFKLGRISGVERPAIATVFPTENSRVLLLDMGANVDNKPKHLQQFGEMGSLYAEHVMHIYRPRVGLLNIGEEKEKGNELTQAAWELLSQSNINFIGNVESKEILSGNVDVVVCDGFVGNLVLKLAESISYRIIDLLKKEISKSALAKIGALFMMPAFNGLKKKIDYDEYGGAQLLGVNGVCVKAHGRAKARAIMNAIRVANESVKENIVECIKQEESK
ncbi:phosphate acyltransferase PlsX [Candidatus Saganbacteria bacterium]|nr:phosphate acyltransferase PlsX [Candidatus Saganbacteria bacterium]